MREHRADFCQSIFVGIAFELASRSLSELPLYFATLFKCCLGLPTDYGKKEKCCHAARERLGLF